MKKYIFFFVLSLVATTVKAQSGYTYLKYGVGFGASYVHPYADLKKENNNLAYNVNFEYNISPYVPLAAEVQFGKLSGGSIVTDESKRQYANSYKAIILHGDLQLGEVIEYDDDPFLNVVKNFYFGTGIGVLFNNVNAQRISLTITGDNPPYIFPGKDKTMNPILPIRFGYEFKIYNDINEPDMRIYIGYVHNMTFGEGLDGYTDPDSHFKNNSLDQYRQITIGVKFNFGTEAVYSKTIRPF